MDVRYSLDVIDSTHHLCCLKLSYLNLFRELNPQCGHPQRNVSHNHTATNSSLGRCDARLIMRARKKKSRRHSLPPFQVRNVSFPFQFFFQQSPFSDTQQSSTKLCSIPPSPQRSTHILGALCIGSGVPWNFSHSEANVPSTKFNPPSPIAPPVVASSLFSPNCPLPPPPRSPVTWASLKLCLAHDDRLMS